MHNCECIPHSVPINRCYDNHGFRWAVHLMVCMYLSAVMVPSVFPTSSTSVDAFVPASRPQVKRHTTPKDVSTRERIFSRTTPLNVVAKSGGKMIETVEEFEGKVLAEDLPRPVLAFFSAAWCGPCRLSIPVVKEIGKQFNGQIDVVEICTDDLAETSADCGVVSIPTIQFYYQGELLDTIVGCVAKSVLSSAVTKILDDIAIESETSDGDQ